MSALQATDWEYNGGHWFVTLNGVLQRHLRLNTCVRCGRDFVRHPQATMCASCRDSYLADARRAMVAVARAVKEGTLPKLTGDVPCVDCGQPAWHYDHRDYALPLDVVPVCRRCNRLRGPVTIRQTTGTA